LRRPWCVVQKPRGFWTTHQGLRKEYEKRIAA